MCISGTIYREKKGGGVVLIKAAHLQPIKEPLFSISPNLLQHAAPDVQMQLGCARSLSLIRLYLCCSLAPAPDQDTEPGLDPVILSGMLRDAFG